MSNVVLERVQDQIHHVTEIGHEVQEKLSGRKAEKVRAEQEHLRQYIGNVALVGHIVPGIGSNLREREEHEAITAYRAARLLHSNGLITRNKRVGIRPMIPDNEQDSAWGLIASAKLLRGAIISLFPDSINEECDNYPIDFEPIVLKTSRDPRKASKRAYRGLLSGIREFEDQIDFLKSPPSGIQSLGLIAITNSKSDYMAKVFRSFDSSSLAYGGVATLYTIADPHDQSANRWRARWRPESVYTKVAD